jgi:hypothetical protein
LLPINRFEPYAKSSLAVSVIPSQSPHN